MASCPTCRSFRETGTSLAVCQSALNQFQIFRGERQRVELHLTDIRVCENGFHDTCFGMAAGPLQDMSDFVDQHVRQQVRNGVGFRAALNFFGWL